MPDDDTTAVVVATYRGHWESDVMVGNVRRCHCGHLAWMTDTAEDLIANVGAYSICSDCYQASEVPADAILRAVPGSLAAIRDRLGDEAAERARAAMHRHGIAEG